MLFLRNWARGNWPRELRNFAGGGGLRRVVGEFASEQVHRVADDDVVGVQFLALDF